MELMILSCVFNSLPVPSWQRVLKILFFIAITGFPRSGTTLGDYARKIGNYVKYLNHLWEL